MKITSTSHAAGAKPANQVQNVAKKSDASKAAFGAGVRDTDGSTRGTQKSESHPRFDAFAKKIEARFENALASKDLSPRQREALEKARDDFHSMMNRLEDAFLDGRESAGRGAINGLDKLMERFAGTVNHIFSGGNGAGGNGDADAQRVRSRNDNPALNLGDTTFARGNGIDAVG